VRIVVVAVGKLKPPWADDVEHYRKLLAGHVRLELRSLREGEDVRRRVPDRAHLCVLDRAGHARDSLEWAQWLEERRQSRRDLCFVLGGPTGIELDSCDEKLSFGPVTLPYQLARVVLLEQVYRAHKILAREPYHY
jgi:23S rRNA (pseudouridine1915-N3)-methyltransferase